MMRVSSEMPSTVISPSTTSPVRWARAMNSTSESLAHVPTQSVWYIVWPVAGRTCATTAHRWSAAGT